MNYTAIRIPLEEEMSKDIFALIDGEIIEDVIRTGQVEKSQQAWKHVLEGHSFRISETLAPKLYSIINDVLTRLEFTEPVDFFISSSQEMNAYSISAIEEGHRHIVTFNAGIIDRLDDDELKFVIGHELGHIFTRNARIMNLIRFVFPDESRIPMILARRINLWQKLAELTADRYGFIACPSIEKCVSAFFKMSSGLSSERISFDFRAYLLENEQILDHFRQENIGDELSHPVNPIRIKHIGLFGESELYRNIAVGKECGNDEKLTGELEKLTEMLMIVSGTELDTHRMYFIAAAGIVMARTDGNIDEAEYIGMLQQLSGFSIFPEAFVSHIADTGKAEEILNQAADALLSINPAERYPMLNVLFHVCFANGRLAKEEIEKIYSIGENTLKFSRAEIAREMAAAIQERFLPKVYR